MLIFNKEGKSVDPSMFPAELNDFDSIYGGMTVGKTTLMAHLVSSLAVVDTDALWQLLYPCDDLSLIWDLKRSSPDVDAALSGPVRMLALDLASSSGALLVSNMGLAMGRSLKVVRDGETTYLEAKERSERTGKKLKISRRQLIEWSQSWMKHDPRFEFTVQLDRGEYLSDLFSVRLTTAEIESPNFGAIFELNYRLLTENFAGSVDGLVSPFPKEGISECYASKIFRLRKEKGYV